MRIVTASMSVSEGELRQARRRVVGKMWQEGERRELRSLTMSWDRAQAGTATGSLALACS